MDDEFLVNYIILYIKKEITGKQLNNLIIAYFITEFYNYFKKNYLAP